MWEGLKNTIGKTWNNPYASSFRNYSAQGTMIAGGFEPMHAKSARGGGGVVWKGFNALMGRQTGQIVPDMIGPQGAKNAAGKFISPGRAGRMLTSAAGAGFSAYNVYSGYQEGGFLGAKDAAVWEVATASAAARFAYGTLGSSGPQSNRLFAKAANVGIKTAGTKIAFGGGGGMALGMARFAGAGIGASLGQAVLGTPGAFMGAYIGAAPIRFAATHPLLAAGGAVIGVAAAAGYGAVKGGASVLRAGHEHRQRQRSIDTSGSMASFMTQNAHTMRARAVQAMHKSHLNARSALGQEAGFMHMPSKNYHSRYR